MKRRRKSLGAAQQSADAITFGLLAGGVMLGAFAGNKIRRTAFASSLGALAGFVLGSLAVGYRMTR